MSKIANRVDGVSRSPGALLADRDARIALLALVAIVCHLWLRHGSRVPLFWANAPLVAALAAGGLPLVIQLAWRALHGEFGADHLAAISIVAAALLDQYLAGVIVVLMLSGGNALEQFAVAEATSVLRALARRVPTVAHRRRGTIVEDIVVDDIHPGDELSGCRTRSVPLTAKSFRGMGRWTNRI